MAPTKEPAATIPTAPAPAPHFILVPLVALGHTIPMVDLARLLTERGARASVITTPLNAARLRGVADHAKRANLPLEIVALPFLTDVPGLPPGCENIDQATDLRHFPPMFAALQKLAGPLEAHLRALSPRPACIVSDWCNPWTAPVARRLGIPRLFFHGPSCFYSLCDLNASAHGLRERVGDVNGQKEEEEEEEEEERFVVPGMPVRVEVTRATIPGFFSYPGFEALREAAVDAMRTADGAVVNTFVGLERQFVSCYEATLGKPVWTLGPLCLASRDAEAAASRGDRLDAQQQGAVAAWLDERDPDSVVYVSFGSLARKLPKQLYEVGHGLEDSGTPFLWVVKESEAAAPEVQEWLAALEARTAGRGLVVRGWAPQLAILSHRAVGGFVTHCGWNSILESVAHGVPVVTWPHFSDQFLNERLIVDVLRVGVPVGATAPVMMFDDEGATVTRGDVARAVAALMDGGEEAVERRKRARAYGEEARRAMERGGSSYESLTQMIESFRQSGASMQQAKKHEQYVQDVNWLEI